MKVHFKRQGIRFCTSRATHLDRILNTMSEHTLVNETAPERESDDLESEATQDDENTPLLSREDGTTARNDDRSLPRHSAVSFLRSVNGSHSGKRSLLRRWQSLLALAVLCVTIVIILVLGFVTPQVAKEYASQAAQFESKRLSIDSYTDTGVVARVEGYFTMDASKVPKKSVRDFGRFGSRIARYVKIGETNVRVSLPHHGGILLGTAIMPSTRLCIINGCTTDINALISLEPGPQEDLRQVANDWIDGRLQEYVVAAKADVSLKSGIFGLGTHSITHTVTFDGKISATLTPIALRWFC